jgi:hypothetical protein
MRLVRNLGVFAGLIGAVAGAQNDSLRPQIEALVDHAVGWYAFWQSTSPEAALDGRALDVKAVRFRNRWVVFVPSMRLLVTATSQPDAPGSLISVEESELFGGSGEAAFRQYRKIFTTENNLGCGSVGQASRTDPTTQRLPVARPCLAEPDFAPITELDFRVVLPPRSNDPRRSLGADPLGVAGLARSWLRRYYPQSSGQMVLPKYSALDPRVYVFLRIRNGPDGILVFQRDPDGQVIAGKFLERRDSVDFYRSRIERRSGAEVDW